MVTCASREHAVWVKKDTTTGFRRWCCHSLPFQCVRQGWQGNHTTEMYGLGYTKLHVQEKPEHPSHGRVWSPGLSSEEPALEAELCLGTQCLVMSGEGMLPAQCLTFISQGKMSNMLRKISTVFSLTKNCSSARILGPLQQSKKKKKQPKTGDWDLSGLSLPFSYPAFLLMKFRGVPSGKDNLAFQIRLAGHPGFKH